MKRLLQLVVVGVLGVLAGDALAQSRGANWQDGKSAGTREDRWRGERIDPDRVETKLNGRLQHATVLHGPTLQSTTHSGAWYTSVMEWEFAVDVAAPLPGLVIECHRPSPGGNHQHYQCEPYKCAKPVCGDHNVPPRTVSASMRLAGRKFAEKLRRRAEARAKERNSRMGASANFSKGGGGVDVEGESGSSSSSSKETEESDRTETGSEQEVDISGSLSVPGLNLDHFAPSCSSQRGVLNYLAVTVTRRLTVQIRFFVPDQHRPTLGERMEKQATPDSDWPMAVEILGYVDLGPRGGSCSVIPNRVFKTEQPVLKCLCKAVTARTGRGHSDDDDTHAPSAPPVHPTPPPGRGARTGPRGPGAPAGPTTSGYGSVGMEPLVNFATIGAGDKFATAITVGSAENADTLRGDLETGGVQLTQNGAPVPFKVIAPPQYADAFAPDPETTIWVETTVIPSSRRELKLGLEQPSADPSQAGTPISSTTMLTQPRAAFVPTPNGVEIQITGAETPWGEQEPKFELHPKNTDAMSPSPNGTDEGGTGSKIIAWLGETAVSLGTVAGLYYVGTLLDPDDDDPSRGGGVQGGGQGQGGGQSRPTSQGVPAGDGMTPGDIVSGTKGTWTVKGHNSFPTGATPADGNPAITNVSGMSGVVMDPSFTPTPDAPVVPYLPAFKTGDHVTVSVAWDPAAGQVPADGFNVLFLENGTVVATLAPISTTTSASGVELLVLVEEFVFGTVQGLEVVVTHGARKSKGMPFTTVVWAEALLQSAIVAEGGITTIPFKVYGVGELEQWVVTADLDSLVAELVRSVIFGEGQQGGSLEIKGNVRGIANLFLSGRRVDE